MINRPCLSVDNGVSAIGTADTPLPLADRGWDQVALETLEFHAALERVAAFAAGPLAEQRLMARRPSVDLTAIREALLLVDEAAGLARGGEPLTIDAVPDPRSALARLALDGSVLEPPDLLQLRRLIAVARRTAGELRRVQESAPRVAALLGPLPAAGLGRRLETSVDDDGRLLDSAGPGLASARKAVHASRSRLIKKLESLLQTLGGGSAAGAVTVRSGRYVIPVRRDQRDRPAGIIHDESASRETLFVEPTAMVELGNALREAEVAEEREVLRVLRELTAELRPHQGEFESALEMCIAADELQALANYADAVGGYCPSLVSAPGLLAIRDGRHPLLIDGDAPVVPFTLVLDENERTLIVSGPNTGGKTVLLKAVGLLGALAQSGIIPPIGPESTLPLFSQCFADIGDHQSIAASLSTFSAHLGVLRRILGEAGPDSLVLIDEMGSGTDPAEGAALAGAALSALTRRDITTIATTHLGALKQLSERVPRVVNGSLQFDSESLRPTYRFQKGIPGRSYGLAIGRRLGLDPAVLAEAEAGLPEVERHLESLLAAVEGRERNVERRESELGEREEVSHDRANRLMTQAASLEARIAAQDERERTAERSARERAKVYLLEARRRVEHALGLARAAVDEATAKEARRLVEEGVQAEAGALQRMGVEDTGGEPDVTSDRPVSVGHRVRLASGMTGEVVERRGDGRFVVLVGSLRTVVKANEVVGVLEEGPSHDSPRAPARTGGVAVSAAPLEIDLRGLTGDDAEAATVAAIDGAVLAEHPYLMIIHGMGTGVVRQRVRRVLEHDGRIRSFEYAPRNQGGTGVTIAEFAP